MRVRHAGGVDAEPGTEKPKRFPAMAVTPTSLGRSIGSIPMMRLVQNIRRVTSRYVSSNEL